MEIVIMLAFIGLMLVAGALLLLGHSLKNRDHEFADRLALLPIQEDASPVGRQEGES